MSVNPSQLMEKLKALPPQRLAEVEDFVNFLQDRDSRVRDQVSQRLGDAMAKLDALDLPAMTADEVQAEITAARVARRAAPDAAGR